MLFTRHRRIPKSAVRTVVALRLVLIGYSACFLVQAQRDLRFTAAADLYRDTKLHKQLSVGAYSQALHDTESDLGADVHNACYTTSFSELPGLLRGDAANQFAANWQDGAFAAAVGLHRARPDVAFPNDAKTSLEAFVPRDKVAEASIGWYSGYRPVP